MRRRRRARTLLCWSTVAGLVASLAACEKPPELPTAPGNVGQPGALAIVGNRIFISSLSQNGLRVAELDPTDDEFVPAPNPLFSLSIPTVRRPAEIAAVAGARPLLASLSSVDEQLRFVDPEALVPLGRPVALPGRPVAAAFAAAGDRLFVVVDAPAGEETPAGLVVLDLSPGLLSGEPLPRDADPVAGSVVFPLDAVPLGIAVSEAGGTPSVWVSDVRAPELLRVDPDEGTVERVPCGLALGRLQSSPAVEDLDPAYEAGRFVYGLSASGRSIVAVDVVAGKVAEAMRFGERILPIELPTEGVSLAAAPEVILDISRVDADGTVRVRSPTIPILLLVPLLDGRVLLADGVRMRVVDQDADLEPLPSLVVSPPVDVVREGVVTEELDRSAPILLTRPNPDYDPMSPTADEPPHEPVVTLTPGVTRSRTWRIAWRPLVPGLGTLSGSLSYSSGVAVVPSSPPADLAERVKPGDVLYILSWYDVSSGVPEGCDAYAEVESLNYEVVSATDGRIEIAERSGPLPTAECFRVPIVFQVRAFDYVVTASGLDTFFRISPGETFVYQGERFVETDPLIDGPEIRFTLATEQNEEAWSFGAARELIVSSGLEPATRSVDAASLNLVRAALPGRPAVQKSSEGVGGGRFFVPYEGSGYVISFDLRTSGRQKVLR